MLGEGWAGAVQDKIQVGGSTTCSPFARDAAIRFAANQSLATSPAARGSPSIRACPNVKNLMYDPDRRIEVEWDNAADASRYIVRLTMQVEDRKGILADVSSRIAAINTNITNVEATGADSDHLGRINMAVEIKDVKHLEKVIKLLRGVEGVLDVERSAART